MATRIKIAPSILSARFDRLGERGVDALTIHMERDDDVRATIRAIRDAGVRPGVVLNPATPFEKAVPFLGDVDLLLVMTVHPGFAGQGFRHDQVPKIREARAHIDREGLAVELEVDGGIKVDTAPIVGEAGADILVSGSGIFPDRVAENLAAIRAAAERARASATAKR